MRHVAITLGIKGFDKFDWDRYSLSWFFEIHANAENPRQPHRKASSCRCALSFLMAAMDFLVSVAINFARYHVAMILL